MKRYGLLPALLAALLLLTACQAAGGEDQEDQDPEMVTLIYANLTEGGVDQKAIKNFNVTHQKAGICIEVRDYFDENGQSGVERLISEMVSGRVPDIIDLGDAQNGLPYRQLALKGYLEDLWPYINNDPQLNDGQVWEAPLKAAEVDGGLYTVFSDVGISTLIGRESVVGTGCSWSLEDLRNAFATMPDGSTVLEYYLTKSEVFYYMFRMNLDNYVNWETGESTFDSDSFRAALEFVNTFPDAYPSLEFEGGWEKAQLEVQDRIRYGEQMLSAQVVWSGPTVPILDKVYASGERVSFIGYPMEDGSAGSAFTIMGTKLAMSSTCKDKEAAWEFLRKALLKRYTTPHQASRLGFHLNRSDYDLMQQFETDPDLDGFIGFYDTFFNETVEVYVARVLPEQRARLDELMSSIDKIELYDNTLYDIVFEASGPYFAGDKTMDETIQMIQNRVRLYVNEFR